MNCEKFTSRTLDTLGRIALPEYERNVLGWQADDRIQIILETENSQLILRKSVDACIYCGNREDALLGKYPYLCRNGLQKLLDE